MMLPRTHKPFFVLLLLCLFLGCASDYGRLKHKPEITQLFKAHEQLSNHRYYYTGRAAGPYAIIGVSSPYTQTSRAWTLIDSNSGQFGQLVDNMFVPGEDAPRGARILNPNGEQIGVWYSIWYFATIEIKAPHEVAVYSPYSPNQLKTFSPY